MSPFILFLFFFLRVTTLYAKQNVIDTCDTNACTGKMEFVLPPPLDTKIAVAKIKAVITRYPDTVEVGMVDRRHLHIYCYDGTFLDPNTRCEEETDDETPTPQQARSWLDKNKCPTGLECPPDGQCYGSDAQKCYSKTETTKVGPSVLKWSGTRYFYRFYHTCVTSWRCNNIRTVVNTDIDISPGSKDRYYYTTKDGEKIDINTKLFDMGHVDMSGMKHYLIDREPSRKSEEVMVRCYSTSVRNTKCVVTTEESQFNGKTFEIKEYPHGKLRSSKMTLKGPILTLEKGKVVTLGEGKLGNSPLNKLVSNPQRAASVESVQEAVNALSVIQMQEIYNSHEMERQINKLLKYVTKIIKELSLKDPKAMSRVLGGSYATKWVSERYFQTCPCRNMSMKGITNCEGEIRFLEGSYLEHDDDEGCYTIAEANVTKVQLLNEKVLMTDVLQNLPVNEANTDSSAWDDVQRLRIKTLFAERQDEKYLTANGVKAVITSMIPSFDLSYWFFMFSSVVSWIALVLVIRSIRVSK